MLEKSKELEHFQPIGLFCCYCWYFAQFGFDKSPLLLAHDRHNVILFPVIEILGTCIFLAVLVVASLCLHLSAFNESLLPFICLYVSSMECLRLSSDPELSIKIAEVSLVLVIIPSNNFLFTSLAR